MIIILDNVLNSDECNNLIEIYQQNNEYAHTHGYPTIYPLNINKILNNKDNAIKIAKKIENTVTEYFNKNVIDWCEIVRWPCDSWQSYHLDKASEKTTLVPGTPEYPRTLSVALLSPAAALASGSIYLAK